ncbi:hypothetical protein MXB_3199, partial [Myxobolus squamalis]
MSHLVVETEESECELTKIPKETMNSEAIVSTDDSSVVSVNDLISLNTDLETFSNTLNYSEQPTSMDIIYPKTLFPNTNPIDSKKLQ